MRPKGFMGNAAAVALSLAAAVSAVAVDKPAARLPVSKVRVVQLEGPPYRRGLTHGKLLGPEIRGVIRKWKEHLGKDYRMAPEVFIEKFLKSTDFLPAIREWTPDLLEEVKGIADGSEVDFSTMLAFQLPDEEWVNAPYMTDGHCSAVGLDRRGGRPALIAQNLDLNGFYNGGQVVLRIKPGDGEPESLVFTCAGLIAACGMNDRPVAVCVNTLGQLAHCRDGLPVAFVIRGLLGQKSQEEAVRFLGRIRHASGQNYIIGGPEGARDFECSANRVVEYRPGDAGGVVCHTNHPLANDDLNAEFRAMTALLPESQRYPGSTSARLQALTRRLAAPGAETGADAVQAALRSRDSEEHPVCHPYRGDAQDFTFGSLLMILSGNPEMRVTAGPPDKSGYRTFGLSAPPLCMGTGKSLENAARKRNRDEEQSQALRHPRA